MRDTVAPDPQRSHITSTFLRAALALVNIKLV